MSVDIAARIRTAVDQDMNSSARSKQSAARLIGPSEIGGCRAYLAHMIADTPYDDDYDDIKWAAYVGTYLGAAIENGLARWDDTRTQVPLTATYPSGLQVSGHCDLVFLDEGIGDVKGLALDTPLPTPTGWTTMGDVRVGDQVIDMHGNPVPVVLKSQVKNLDCYRVSFNHGSFSITCDGEHIWWVLDKHGRLREMPVTDLIGRKFLRVPHTQPIDLPEADLPVDPWLLGYWLGDGSSQGMTLSTHRDDAEHIATTVRALGLTASTRYLTGSGAYVNVSNGARGRDDKGRFVDAPLHKAMADLGVLGNKHIPKEYLRGSVEQRLALLRGLMDADGTWHTSRRQAQFTSTTKNLRDGVAELARSLGQRVSVHEQDVTGFGLTVRAYTCSIVASVCPFTLPRQVAKFEAQVPRVKNHGGAFSITKVEKVETVPTQCILVDSPTHSFLAGEQMVPTHNTKDGLQLVRRTPPSLQYLVQVNTYLLAAIQAGLVPADATWSLIYVDRSGECDEPYVVSGQLDMDIIKIAESRLDDALYAAEHDLADAPRDMPHDWCVKVCPFYGSCRGVDEHQVQGLITSEDHLAAVKAYREGLALEKEGKAVKDQAKKALAGISGSTGEFEISWTWVDETTMPASVRSGYNRMTVRKIPTRKLKS